jgi:hypothetical protein
MNVKLFSTLVVLVALTTGVAIAANPCRTCKQVCTCSACHCTK